MLDTSVGSLLLFELVIGPIWGEIATTCKLGIDFFEKLVNNLPTW
jgi:hypothetical protein